MNGFYRVINWDTQKNIWWQLYWRSPKIKSNAFLIFDFPKLNRNNPKNLIINFVKWYQIYWIDYQIWATGNLFFNYNDSPDKHFRGELLTNPNVIENIEKHTEGSYSNRNLKFPMNYSNSIILSTPTDTTCLWVYDKDRQELPQHPNQVIEPLISYSDINNLVQTDQQGLPPKSIFGNEPEKSWCYYFQKASLFRQLKDWNQLSLLTSKVMENKFEPDDVNEWLPFIEGLIVLKKYPEANDLIKNVLNKEKQPDIFITNVCTMAKRLKSNKIISKCQH
jgi:hypothetical protein